MSTRTGGYRIGFRAGATPWQQDLNGLTRWAKDVGFSLIDLTQVGGEDVRTVRSAGLDVMSVDLITWPALLSEDEGKRKACLDANRARIRDMALLGVKVFFAVVIPENPDAELKRNFALAVESYGELARTAEAAGTAIVLEGWPGMPPKYANLCCNPEQYRAILKEVPSRGLMINFDSSHLIRMNIDHVRFIDEFAGRVGHVHGKDCEILTDAVYDIGVYQHSLTQEPHRFGEFAWRYTIPGHGVTRWSYVLRVLQAAGYKGAVSVELEDEQFNGTEDGEKRGLIVSLAYLQTV
jgi:sugar phosphate isomerase/epimerase